MSTAAPESQATLEQRSATNPATDGNLSALRRALVFGTGLGIAIGEQNLEIAIVRSRPAGPAQFASASIADFRNRPAAQWGAELSTFIAQAGGAGLAATVLLPRSEVIVRTLSLPGVADKEIANAIELQVDTLHPWGDVDVAWGWARAGASHADVMVGLARKEILDSYEALFSEAGIRMAAVTFSSAVIHSAIRIWSGAPATVLCFRSDAGGRTEVYGESDSRSVFSAEFSLPQERALALARAELRLPPDYPAKSLIDLLPQVAGTAPMADHLTADHTALAYAAALAGSAPRVARFPNLLPPERRASHDRMQFLVPGILGSLLVLALVTVFAIFPAIEQRRYRDELTRAARQLEPAALRAQALDKKTIATRARIAQLDELRRRPQADLEVLNELTKLLPPPIWTSSVEIYPDSVVISGEADQASSLLKVLDGSPLFQNSEFTLGVTRNAQTEQFRIKTLRRGRAGRTTP
jgi:Tfp pilus assembly protein PilN